MEPLPKRLKKDTFVILWREGLNHESRWLVVLLFQFLFCEDLPFYGNIGYRDAFSRLCSQHDITTKEQLFNWLLSSLETANVHPSVKGLFRPFLTRKVDPEAPLVVWLCRDDDVMLKPLFTLWMMSDKNTDLSFFCDSKLRPNCINKYVLEAGEYAYNRRVSYTFSDYPAHLFWTVVDPQEQANHWFMVHDTLQFHLPLDVITYVLKGFLVVECHLSLNDLTAQFHIPPIGDVDMSQNAFFNE
jgi:hypothetical protein